MTETAILVNDLLSRFTNFVIKAQQDINICNAINFIKYSNLHIKTYSIVN